MKHKVHELFLRFSKEFYATGPQRLTQMCEKNVLILEETLWEK